MKKELTGTQSDRKIPDLLTWQKNIKAHALPLTAAGLDAAAIACRQDKQQINRSSAGRTATVGSIIRRNLFTVFNLLNFVLALFILIAAAYKFTYIKNGMFMGVVVFNLIIGIYQEIKAKLLLDKLAILVEPQVSVKRRGQIEQIKSSEILENDLLEIKSGMQIPVDGIIFQTDGIIVDEALLTGEAEAISKKNDDIVYAGTLCTAGEAWIQACLVGDNSFAALLTANAKIVKQENSRLRLGLNKLISILAAITLPLFFLIFMKNYYTSYDWPNTLVLTAGAIIGMIPEGLVLLTEVAFALAAFNLGKNNCLLQKTAAVEILASTDILCLDKTGTITDGCMQVSGILLCDAETCSDITPAGMEGKENLAALALYILQANKVDNLTAAAINNAFGKYAPIIRDWQDKLGVWEELIPFSSEKKYTAVRWPQVTYYLGAAEFILAQTPALSKLQPRLKELSRLAYRVLLLAEKENQAEIKPLALILLTDGIRPDAARIFNYFKAQNVDVKIISGDNPETVRALAAKANFPFALTACDLSSYGAEADYDYLIRNYNLFGRVSPGQKKQLLAAYQAAGKVVTMTGDGVNDIPALKKADCAVAMCAGADACRRSADIVLLDNQLAHLIAAVYEGRRVINNIKLVASLFLTKTFYSSLLCLLYLCLPLKYPLYPVDLTLISTLTIGIPAFFLTLQANKAKVKGDFWRDVYKRALIPSLIAFLYICLWEFLLQHYPTFAVMRSWAVLLTLAASAFALLTYSARPFNCRRFVLITVLLTAFILLLLIMPGFFALPFLPLAAAIKAAAVFVGVFLTVYFVLNLGIN